MCKRLILCIFVLSSLTLRGADFDVRKYGAKGDGQKNNTEAIQKAIDACHKVGGGRVVLQEGVYMTGPIELKSGVNLYIDVTARLLASPNIEDYPEWPNIKHVISENLQRGNRNTCLILADEAERIAITGRGVIDGNGTYYVRKEKRDNAHGWQYVRIYPNEQSIPRLVFLTGCKDVLLEDVTMLNQPSNWSYQIHDCDRVTIRGLQILAELAYENNDGIHVNCSRDVTISDCHIETGDDCIIVRANSRSLREKKPCERITVTNCVLRSGSGCIRLGWTNDGVIRHCTFSNLVMTDSFCGLDIYLPHPIRKDYGIEPTLIEDMSFSNITMTGMYGLPIKVNISPNPDTMVEAVRDLRFSNVHAVSKLFPYFHGREGSPVRRFVFDNCSFTREAEPGKPQPEIFQFAEGFVFNNTSFTTVQVPEKDEIK